MANARRRSFWFFAVLTAIPLVYSNATIDPALTLRAILLAVLTIVTIIATWKRPIRTSPLVWIWCLYAAFEVISISAAQNSGEAIYEASLALLYGAWLFAAMQMVTKAIVPNLLRTISILGIVTATIALLQNFGFGFGFLPGGAIPYATMTMRNMMSSFLFLTLPAGLFLLLSEGGYWRIFGLVTFFESLMVLLIAQTRAVWLAGLISLLAATVAFLLWADRTRLWRRYGLGIRNAGIIALACAAIVFLFHLTPYRSARDTADPGSRTTSERLKPLLNYSEDTSANMRLTVWHESLEMFGAHPALGVGAGNWKIALPAYGLAKFPHYVQDGNYQWTETHNDFLAVLCEAGVGGGLAYLVFFIAAIYLCIEWLRRTANPSEAIISIWVLAAVIGFGIISFFDFPKARVEHSMIFLLWLSLEQVYREPRNAILRPKSSWKYCAILLAIPGLLFSGERFRAEQHEKTLLEARINHDWDQEIAECNKIYDAKLLSLDALATPILYYRAEGEFMEQNYPAALRDNLSALEAFPNHIYTLNNTGSCYENLRNFRAAQVFYKRALGISPNFQESLLNLTAVYFNEGQFPDALATISRCDTSQNGSRAQTMARIVRAKFR